MKVSLNWLKELVDVPETNEFINTMNLSGNEVEKVQPFIIGTNLVVGKVLKKYKHPNSDHLNICEVDIKDEIKTIVCGAQNVDVNQKVIVAKEGAILKDFEIKKAKIRGIDSDGMICSLSELGIENKYLNEEEKNGIHVLSDDFVVGEEPLKDIIVEFNLTPNRGDLLGMINMAKETSAIFKTKTKDLKFDLIENKEKIKNYIKVINKTEDCSAYLSRIIKNIEIKESPSFIKYRLISAGIRPINNIVDISNYVMLLYNQPLHFFDYDKLGNEVIIRKALKDETLITLDNVERTLNENDIVIANNKEVVALAGVMGGLSTEITNNTKNILIESANFKSSNIRKTSQRVLRSESSIRFEKNISNSTCKDAINTAAYLLQKYASAEIVNGVEGFINEKEDVKINISTTKINSILGIELKTKEINDILNRLGFIVNENTAIVPKIRTDILIEEDVIEEVGRIYGYYNLKGVLPKLPIKEGKRSKELKYIKTIKDLLVKMNLNEVITYSLIKEEDLNKYVNEDFKKVELKSYLSEDKKTLRYSLINSLINTYEYNIYRNNKNINIFEIGKGFYKETTYKEDYKLGILLSENFITNSWNNENMKSSFYILKGILENIFNYFYYEYEFKNQDKEIEGLDYYLNIFIDNMYIGYIGKLNKKEVFVTEINLQRLMKIQSKSIKFKEIPKYPNIIKDMAFIFDKDINSIDVVNYIKTLNVENVEVFDFYKNIEKNKNSIAFKLTFNDLNRTLTDEEVLIKFNDIIKKIENKFNAKLRDK